MIHLLVFSARGVDSSSAATQTTAIIAVLAILGCVVYLFLNEKNGKWDDGLIPKNFKPTRDNLLEIYISAGCAIIARDPENNYMKFALVHSYLRENFRREFYDFSESYSFSLRHIVKIDSLADWCNKHLNENQKAQFLNYMVYLAVSDGYFVDEEKRYIHVLTQKLKLTFDHVAEEFKSHFYAEEKKVETRTYSSKQRFFKTLGLEENATIKEIKDAYRKLAKLTHPDRFMNESVEMQETMKRKFQEIQEAYEEIAGN